VCYNAFGTGLSLGPSGELTAVPRTVAFRGESRTEMEIKSGEGKWSGKVENVWEERGRAVLKLYLKYPGLGGNDNNCHVLSSPLSSPCPLRNTCPILDRLSRCGWSETNALKPFADTELMTTIRVLSNGMTKHKCTFPRLKTIKIAFAAGSAPDPAKGAYSAPQTP